MLCLVEKPTFIYNVTMFSAFHPMNFHLNIATSDTHIFGFPQEILCLNITVYTVGSQLLYKMLNIVQLMTEDYQHFMLNSISIKVNFTAFCDPSWEII